MKVLFFGVGIFALPILKALHARKNVSIDVITLRQKKKSQQHVQQYVYKTNERPNAKKILMYEIQQQDFSHISEMDINNCNLKHKELINKLCNKYYDLGIIASFGYFIPNKILCTLSYCINIHPSLLPQYRGAAPIEHAILNGDRQTGISIIDVHPTKIDFGNIYMQKAYNIHKDEVRDELMERMGMESAIMLNKLLDCIKECKLTLHPFPQKNIKNIQKATKFYKSHSKIPWNTFKMDVDFYNYWRALGSTVGCWTECFSIDSFVHKIPKKMYIRLVTIEKIQSHHSIKKPQSIFEDCNINKILQYLTDMKINVISEIYFVKKLNSFVINRNVIQNGNLHLNSPSYVIKELQVKSRSIVSALSFANGYSQKNKSFLLYNVEK